ncbi:MAG: Ig domain-containing protein, partial [Bacteroidales bacterium]|nr:Ig domain-containing protein [Bacteroidales bacterium]
MMIKRILQFSSLFSLLGLFAACGGQELDVPVSSVTISRPSAELVIGETVQITATVIPSDATDKNILWSSANPSVATVSNGGLVTAVAEGSTEITASAGGKKASCKVTVSKKVVEVSSVELNKTELSLVKGASETLIATVNPADATNKTIIWDSRDASVASVDGDGKVTALAGGTTVITAMASGKVASCTVTVSVPVESLSLDQTSVTLAENESITLTATVGPADATDKTVTWSSSNPAIATVEDGKVTAIKEGSATITAKAGEKSATCQVTVKKSAIPVESISLDQTSLSLISGESERLTATVKPDNATDKTVTWSSSNTSVVDVDQRGEVRAYESGTAVITAKAGDKSATCTVTVTVPVDRITLDRAAVSLKVGESVKLTATIKPADATDKTITWSSSNPAVAKVENGTVTAISEGSAVITAKAGEKSATCSVTVKNPDEPDEPDEPSATGVVETQQATGITSVEATLNAKFSGATGTIAEVGFIYGKSMTVLTEKADLDPPGGASGSFSTTLSSLDPSTTYYFRAYIVEFDAALGIYVDRFGDMRSFTTEAPAAATTGYLNCYEVPGLTGILNGAEVSGRLDDRDDTWFRYYTNTSSRQIATHTYTLDGKQVRNYTVMYDGSKYAPVWTAHAMHKSM